jgi:hypothetical protein
MLTSTRNLLVLAAGLVWLVLLAYAPAALAGTPASVTVRIEGLTETKLPSTLVTTTATPVVKDGIEADSCPGTSALGALQVATAGNWSGPWEAKENQYAIFTVEGETHEFEASSSANYYWSFWLDNKEATVGACDAELQSADQVLFFPACYGAACPTPEPTPLAIEAPATANAGEAVNVTVKQYNAKGEASPAVGATVGGGGAGAVTDSQGHATLTFFGDATDTLRVSGAPEGTPAVRTETTICIHEGNDGTCGTQAAKVATPPAPGSSNTSPQPVTSYKALVADVGSVHEGHLYSRHNSPRVLSGKVTSSAPITSISIRLRRSYKGHCWAYNGARERLQRVRCGRASPICCPQSSLRDATCSTSRQPIQLASTPSCVWGAPASSSMSSNGQTGSLRGSARALARRPFVALGLAVLLLASCGFGPGLAPAGVRLAVTEGFGARVVSSTSSPRARGQETVMSLLMRNHKVKTRYGGGFVESIDGHSGGTLGGDPADWFYYVNGVEASKGAADTSVNVGDRIWWDLHDWSQADDIPAVVGSYPEPFLHGIDGKRLPVRIECLELTSAPCETVNARLRTLGVPAALAAISPGEETSTLRVLVGPWSAVRGTPAMQAIERGPRASGVYARFAASGQTLTLLDARGQATRTLGAGAGLVAASRYAEQSPVWVVTGTDDAGVALAADALSESALRNRFALALEPSGTALPVPTAAP